MRRLRRVTAGVVVALAFMLAPVLCLRLPFARRVIVANVNRALASTFVGHVVVDSVGGIGWTQVDGVAAHVETVDGERVLRVEGARARVSTWALLRSLVGQGDIVVDLPEISVGSVEAVVDPDESGTLRIAQAFEPRPKQPRS